jgi:maltose O-acetyltransferase
LYRFRGKMSTSDHSAAPVPGGPRARILGLLSHLPQPLDRSLRRLLGMSSGFLVNVVAPAYPTSDGLRVTILRACGMGIGAGTIIKSQCFVVGHAEVRVGEDCFIGARTVLEASAPITIEDRVFIAHRVNLLTATHAIGSPTMRASLPQVRRPIHIGAGCWLGADAAVLPGVTIASGCVIAAGAVVRSDCDANGLYAGVPARRVRDLD